MNCDSVLARAVCRGDRTDKQKHHISGQVYIFGISIKVFRGGRREGGAARAVLARYRSSSRRCSPGPAAPATTHATADTRAYRRPTAYTTAYRPND